MLIFQRDIFSITRLTLILNIISKCDTKHIIKLTIKTIMSVTNNIDVCLDFHNCCNSMHCGYFRWHQFSWISKYEMFDFVILMILISHPLDKVNLGEKDFSILPRHMGKTSYMSISLQNCFPLQK